MRNTRKMVRPCRRTRWKLLRPRNHEPQAWFPSLEYFGDCLDRLARRGSLVHSFASKEEAGEGETFSTQQELASLVAEWPADRLLEVWNGITGLTPVKKFRAIQSLDGGGANEPATWRL